MIYTPDKWVVVEVTSQEKPPMTKVMGGWYGGYLGADEWRFSSMIEVIEDKGTHYEFHNASGSTYVCYKNCFGMNMLMYSVLEHYKHEIEKIGGNIEVVKSYDPHEGETNGNKEGSDKEASEEVHKED